MMSFSWQQKPQIKKIYRKIPVMSTHKNSIDFSLTAITLFKYVTVCSSLKT